MNFLDWFVLAGTLVFIAVYGWWKTRTQHGVRDYLLGDQDQRWWQVGMAVMATQASAITFISTTGQGYSDGLRFIQFYFGLPLAMVIISVWFIPAFYRQQVFTAYEFLEKRFDLRTRVFAASVFLLQRGLAAGITLYAPSIILSSVFGWDLRWTHVCSGLVVIFYTVSGGSRAVSVTQIQQLFVIFVGMVLAFSLMLAQLPESWSLDRSLQLAGAMGKVNPVDFSLRPEDRYNFWSGISGGLFVALAYFGTDQSQVQRYLTGSNISQSRLGMVFNGLMKIPMQFFILSTGVLLLVFMQFREVPLSFNKQVVSELKDKSPSDYERLQRAMDSVTMLKKEVLAKEGNALDGSVAEWHAVQQDIRKEAASIVSKVSPEQETNDKDYVFLHFILNFLPHGMIGLLIAVILCAAMSSISAELNALSGTSFVDFYKRFARHPVSESREVGLTRAITVFWGLVALSFAFYASLFENLIQLINIIGSVFYGSVLGIFLVAFYMKRVGGRHVFPAAVIAQLLVLFLFFRTELGFLWYNVAGVGAVMLLSLIFYLVDGMEISWLRRWRSGGS